MDFSKIVHEYTEYQRLLIPEKSVSFLNNEDEKGYDFMMKRTLRFILIHTAFLANIFKGLYTRHKSIDKHPQEYSSLIFDFHRAISQYHCWNSIVIREMAMIPGKHQYFWTILWNTYYRSCFEQTYEFKKIFPYQRIYQNTTLKKTIREIYQFFHEPLDEESITISSSCSQQFLGLLHREIKTFSGMDTYIIETSMEIVGKIFLSNSVSSSTSSSTSSFYDGVLKEFHWIYHIVYYKSIDDSMSLYYFPKLLGFPEAIREYFEEEIYPILISGIGTLKDTVMIPTNTRSIGYIDLQYIQLLNEYNHRIQKEYNLFLLNGSTHSFLSRSYYNPPDDLFLELKKSKESLEFFPAKPPGLVLLKPTSVTLHSKSS
jgi:hypothetical protein